jgi:hypothetical protein
LWEVRIRPHLIDAVLADKVDASVMYGVLLYKIIHPAWRVMAQGAERGSPKGSLQDALGMWNQTG